MRYGAVSNYGITYGFFHGISVLRAWGGQSRWPSKWWGCVCRTIGPLPCMVQDLEGMEWGKSWKNSRGKVTVKETGFLLCFCRGAHVWRRVNCLSCTVRDLISWVPRLRVELQKCRVLLLQMISWEAVCQTCKTALSAVYFLKMEL